MLKKLQLFAVLFAWMLATGAQWDMLQVVAWSKMFLSNTEDMSVGVALEKTFDGEECEMCRAVRRAKQQENAPGLPSEKRITKLILIFQPVPALVYLKAGPAEWPSRDEVCSGLMRAAPPVPPPRSGRFC